MNNGSHIRELIPDMAAVCISCDNLGYLTINVNIIYILISDQYLRENYYDKLCGRQEIMVHTVLWRNIFYQHFRQEVPHL
jgi:hypothetical protein